MNSVIISGRLTFQPELKTSAISGNAFTNIQVAVDRRFSKEKKADFIDCTAFGKTAEFITSYFDKGSSIILRGTLQSDEYQAQDGSKRKKISVLIDEVNFAGSKASNNDVDDSDLPF